MRILTQGTAQVTDAILRAHMQVLDSYVQKLATMTTDHAYTAPESALAAASDTAMRAHVRTIVDPLKKDLKTVLLVGIGGSDLGARAVYDAVCGHHAAYGVPGSRSPRLLTFGTIEPSVLRIVSDEIARCTDPREIVLVIVSKSGSTTETIANANVLFGAMVERFGLEPAVRQTVLISDEAVELASNARTAQVNHIPMPKNIGGRYSVFTPVGLVPLALLGLDIEAFCSGAVAGARAAAPQKGYSVAAVLAACLYEAYLADIRLHEFFVWHPELETLGKWYRQLLAESIGKRRDDGMAVGIMPTVAVGSVDLHSLGQLVYGGPRNRFTTFVVAPACWDTEPIRMRDNVFMLNMLRDREIGEAMHAIYTGVTRTYATHELPYATIELEDISEREIGACMAVHMASVMCLANLLEVNAFDQPDVETYKAETRKLLAK